MERERERFTALGKGRERYGHDDGEVDSPVKIQAWFRALMTRCSLNTDDLLRPDSVFEHGLWCHGASSLGMRREVKMRRGWEREARRGKIFSENFFGKMECNRGSPNGHTSLRWMGQYTGDRAHLDSEFTRLPLNHGWWVSKTSEKCFHFLSSSLIFLSNRITKTRSPNMSDRVQTKYFPWVPPVLDDEWWKQDYITQNSLHPNNPLLLHVSVS